MKKNKLSKLLLMLSVMSTPAIVNEAINENIAEASQSGWVKNNLGKWYYIDNSGILATNKWIGDYYLGNNGVMLTNTWTPDGYYVDGNGKWVKGKRQLIGWQKDSLGRWYYYENNGLLARNLWKGDYYLGSNGVMLTNTWTPDGYYVDGNGKWVPNKKKEEIKTGWQKDSLGRWYYYENNGTLAMNVWKGNYYLGSNGVMLTNTWTPDGYYVDSNGKWVPNKKKEEIKVGWQKDSLGRWYYYENNGLLARNVWKGDYYLGSNGVMLTNTWTPDGYYVDGNGKWVPNKSKKEELNSRYNSTTNYIKYYSQNDPVWAYKVYGLGNMYNTGCVPTALAMIISTVKHNVSPQTIAEDLYKNTSHFNKKEPGTMAYGTGYILDKYGIRYRLVYSLEQLKSELSKGKIVYAAVGNQPFITNGYTHAIVLRGIDSNGNTTVYNPHSRMGSIRTFNTSKVWAHRSGEREDNQLGSPFIVIDA